MIKSIFSSFLKSKTEAQVLPFEDMKLPTQQIQRKDLSNKHISYKVVDGVARGSFGAVVKVRLYNEKSATSTSSHRHRGNSGIKKQQESLIFAMKMVPKSPKHRKDSQKLMNEIQVMKAISDSPFVQQFYDAYESSNCMFIVSEFIQGGDVFFYFSKSVQFSERKVRIILAELFIGLEHIHSHGFLHCDIKAENIMFDKKGHVKIVDFGLARKLELPEGQLQMPMRQAGSLPYMAPELLADNTGGRHTDWWAYGVLAYELFTGYAPWHNYNTPCVTTMEICHRDITLPKDAFSVPAQFLIISLLSRDYKQRLGTAKDDEIMEAPFFDSIDWNRTASLKTPGAFLPDTSCATIPSERSKSIDAFMKYADTTIIDLDPNNNVGTSAVLKSSSVVPISSNPSTQTDLKPLHIAYNKKDKSIHCVSAPPILPTSSIHGANEGVNLTLPRVAVGFQESALLKDSFDTVQVGQSIDEDASQVSSRSSHSKNMMLFNFHTSSSASPKPKHVLRRRASTESTQSASFTVDSLHFHA